MHAMESLVKLLNEWEIQLLVLLSFTLQFLLFFTGNIRRNNTSGFLRLLIWTSYLGADFVAVYALGFLSRHSYTSIENHIPKRTQPLSFFWAPFLLMHLGGQDTITAFAMEDNNLWLRHLLNLVVQVVLALYVFWKSIGRLHNVDLLVSGFLVFVAGIIKYAERTWSLMQGSIKSIEGSTGHHYKIQLPEETSYGYSGVVCEALHSMKYVFEIFAQRSMGANSPLSESTLGDPNKMLEVVRLELGVMYDDLYTKALVLRTKSAIILRCISQISIVVAFVLFHTNGKQRYSRSDIEITYSLFVGGFFLEACAIFVYMMSPWTWAWLKARKWHRLAGLSWFVFSSNVGWPEKKQRWPNSMGQYNLVSWLSRGHDAGSSGDLQKRRTCKQHVMSVATRLVELVGAKKKKLFWMRKLLDTEYIDVDKMAMKCIVREIILLRGEIGGRHRKWPNLGPMFGEIRDFLAMDIGNTILILHKLTDVHLSKYPPPRPSDMEANDDNDDDDVILVMVEVCRKLSNYMVYLLVTHPSMLPLAVSAGSLLEFYDPPYHSSGRYVLGPTKETLEEMVCMWLRILIYAASKSRVDTHMAQLSRGGELITFTWLLMAHYGFGDSKYARIRIINNAFSLTPHVEEVCAFYVPTPRRVKKRKRRPTTEATNV